MSVERVKKWVKKKEVCVCVYSVKCVKCVQCFVFLSSPQGKPKRRTLIRVLQTMSGTRRPCDVGDTTQNAKKNETCFQSIFVWSRR